MYRLQFQAMSSIAEHVIGVDPTAQCAHSHGTLITFPSHSAQAPSAKISQKCRADSSSIGHDEGVLFWKRLGIMANRQLRGLLGHISQLAGIPVAGGLTDRELLERFAAQRDEAAF